MHFTKYKLLCVGLLLILLTSCKVKKYNVDFTEFETLDTLTVVASPLESSEGKRPRYNAAATRTHDLLHTSLKVSFDWDAQTVLGQAQLRLTPYFYTTDTLCLDAKGMVFKSIKDQLGQRLNYDYNDRELKIHLGKNYTLKDTFEVLIDYIAEPGKLNKPSSYGGDLGLYFINPNSINPAKPRQIWTQGETEYNSRWFPTIDHPNERCTQEIWVTVDENFATLSNGLLIDSYPTDSGKRTDYWKQEFPHAPYLFMLAIGEFSVVKDQWRDVPLAYYVEPKYEDAAKGIYSNTVEMLDFFSNILNYPYPWEKYSQVAVRHFVAGAMENTTATIFGDFVQKTNAQLVDNGNDAIVAHELFHHWFGDLVTCENWANLTLNEGFANYSEYLWQDHKYGHFAAEHHRLNELNGYVTSTIGGTHPLIHYGYEHREDMFDAHSYNKGGLVLHMLRQEIGDEAFFASLHKYLYDNAYTAVEVDELRMAFEDVCGQDLQWFFDQWYMDKGHPILKMQHKFDAENRSLNLTIEQTQDGAEHASIFKLHTTLGFYFQDGTSQFQDILLDHRVQEISIPLDENPKVVVLDATHDMLAEIQRNYTEEESYHLYKHSTEFEDIFKAVERLKEKEGYEDMFSDLLKSPYYYFRLQALDYLRKTNSEDLLAEMSLSDKNANVRASAYRQLTNKDKKRAFRISRDIIASEKSSSVISIALQNLYEENPEYGLKEAEEYYKNDPISLNISLCKIFADTEDPKYLPVINNAILEANKYQFLNLVLFQSKLVHNASPNEIYEAAKTLSLISKSKKDSQNTKFTATNTIQNYLNKLEVNKKKLKNEALKEANSTSESLKSMLQEIYNNETDNSLKKKYLNIFETP